MLVVQSRQAGTDSALRRWAAKHFAFVSRFIRRGRNYAGVVFWLLKRSFYGQSVKLITVTVLSLFYLLGQAAAILVIYWYAQQMQGGGVLDLSTLGIKLAPQKELALLWAVVAASASSLIASASFQFAARTIIAKIVEQDFARSLRELVEIGRRLPDPRVPVANELFFDVGFKDLAGGSRRGALTAIGFSNAIPQVVGAVGAVATLFYLDLPLTLLILIGCILWATLMYPLTLRAVAFARKRQQLRSAFSQEALQLLRLGSTVGSMGDFATAPQVADAFLRLRRIKYEMTLFLQIGATVIVAVGIFYMAREIISGSGNWPIFIAYIGALRIALTGWTQAVQAFANLSRYYPQIAGYCIFMRAAEGINKTSLGRVTKDDTVTFGLLPDGTEIVARAGGLLALLSLDAPPLVRNAFLGAKSGEEAQPLGTAHLDTINMAKADGEFSVALIRPDVLSALHPVDGLLANKVVVVHHSDASQVGKFGEQYLLIVEEGAVTQFVTIGTPESELALKAFAKARTERQQTRVADEDDDDDDE